MSIDVVIADDSAYLRKSIAEILSGSELVNILEFAKDGEEAIKLVKRYSPDVLVLDLVMPKMNGLDAFKVIMEERPTPTVILSAISPKNLDSSIQALLMGAFDYIIKPGGIGAKDLPRFREELLAKVLLASQSQIKKIFKKEDEDYRKVKSIRQEIVDQIFDFGQYLNAIKPIQETEEIQEVIDIGKTKEVQKKAISESNIKQIESVDEFSVKKTIEHIETTKLNKATITKPSLKTSLMKSLPSLQKRKEPAFIPNLTPIKGIAILSNVIVIGASVGGPRTITTILKQMPISFTAPILVVQHLSAHFTDAFADNLNIECKLKVKVANNGEFLKPGVVYIAPGENHMEIAIDGKSPCIKIYKGTPVNFCMPSIDILFFSAARIYRDQTLGVLLTGMGSDGVEGLGAIQKVGGKTISESEETCVLYAMPKFAAEKGYADLILSSYKIPGFLIDFGNSK